MLKKHYTLAVFVAGIIIGMIALNVLTLTSSPAYANAVGGNAAGLIAVTGLCSNNYSGLWVLDARDSRTSPSLCLYIPGSGGRGFRLAAARRIKYDLKLIQYNDRTRGRDMHPSRMRRKVEEMNRKEEEKSRK